MDEMLGLAKKDGIATPYASYLVVPDAPVPVAAAPVTRGMNGGRAGGESREGGARAPAPGFAGPGRGDGRPPGGAPPGSSGGLGTGAGGYSFSGGFGGGVGGGAGFPANP